MNDLLPIAVRAFARTLDSERAKQPAQRRAKRPTHEEAARHPQAVLLLDCETTVDAVQSLNFGAYRYCRLTWSAAGPELVCVEEGLIYADELLDRNAGALACLREYVETREPAVASDVEDAVVGMPLVSRAEFCEQVLWTALSGQATVVGFNLPFDLSRLAIDCAHARRQFAGGFSLTLYGYESAGVEKGNPYRSRLVTRSIDATRSRIRLTTARRGSDSEAALHGHGAFLDLRTFTYALTGNGLSLERACVAFGVPYRKRPVEHGQVTAEYVDYCREDVAATAALYQALATEYERW